MAQLPPWLDIHPTDFLRALAEGTQAGQAASNAAQQAWEHSQRMEMEARAQAQQATERAQQDQGLQLWREGQLQARENALEATKEKNKQASEYQGALLDMRERQGEALNKYREGQLTESQAREADRQAQREFRNTMSEKLQDFRERNMDRLENKPRFEKTDQGLMEVGPNGVLSPARMNLPPTPPDEPGIIGKALHFIGIGGSSATPPASNPQSKVEAAKALRLQHPDWTKQQIIEAVNQ